ncbi:MAG: GspH/FimT family protein [Pseudomonadota bacterium]|nr:GspH/FimT family protein [Pseudomonadota bacterium]
MIAIAMMGMLASYAIPALRNSVNTGRARAVAQRFQQDFAWLRGQATTGSHIITLTVNSDCSWTAVEDNSAVNAHSFTTAQLATAAPGIGCSLGTGSLPLSFTFDNQGFVGNAAALTFSASSGQTFPLQILGSGTLVRINGAS